MTNKLLIIALLFISTAATAQKLPKDSTYFTSTEDTVYLFGNNRKTMTVVHIDWKCRLNDIPPSKDSNDLINRIWIYNFGTEWYRYTKQFILTDTGWKRIK